jgi:hypothetical protein
VNPVETGPNIAKLQDLLQRSCDISSQIATMKMTANDNIVECIPVPRQRPRNKQLYDSR